VLAAIALALAGAFGGAIPVTAHSYSCHTGNSNQVVIVFEAGSQGGANDDLCWKDGASYDDQFSTNDASVDDIGENQNFHDIVSSLEIINNGADGLCVQLYIDAFRSVFGEALWVGAGQGAIHFNSVDYNDAYDSIELRRISQASCLN
jgi:hypothetical protein